MKTQAPAHTPEPWTIHGNVIVGVRPDSTLPLAVAEVYTPIHYGKTPDDPYAQRDMRMGNANRSLIAAAPSMLTALEWARDVFADYAPPLDDDATLRFDDGWRALLATIAAAKGDK